ncbi:hypothetical protein EGP95_00505 [bacterium]|nr:hypothetical protein [bacterium]
MRDKEKILMLVALIIFIVVLLLSFTVIAYFNIKEENKVPKHDKTTIQESTTTKESTIKPTTKIITEATTEITTTKTNTTKVTTTATKKITTKVTTTTTEEIVSIVNPSELDEWCLNIFNIINDTRKRNGLNTLSLKKDIRDLAIDASIKWESIHDEGLKSYLYGYNYYGYQSNILSSNNGYKVIANETLKNTDVGTNKYLNYVGININKVDNKYYFIIIYE